MFPSVAIFNMKASGSSSIVDLSVHSFEDTSNLCWFIIIIVCSYWKEAKLHQTQVIGGLFSEHVIVFLHITLYKFCVSLSLLSTMPYIPHSIGDIKALLSTLNFIGRYMSFIVFIKKLNKTWMRDTWLWAWSSVAEEAEPCVTKRLF